MSAPASHLVLLNDLPLMTAGTKVRILGCIHSYDIRTAALYLRHPRSGNATTVSAPVTALVDTLLLAKQLRAMDVTVGEWVNVIGYVSDVGASDLYDSPAGYEAQDGEKSETDSASRSQSGARVVDQRREVAVHVQALLLWSAGAVDIREYERAADRFQSTARGLEADVLARKGGG